MTDDSQPTTIDHRLSATRVTAGGRGAIAVIVVEGDSDRLATRIDACFQAANGRRIDLQLPGRLVFGTWGSESGEDVVACRTANGRCEIHCHGGDAAVQRILVDLAMESRESPVADLKSELEHALSQAPTWTCANLLNEQARSCWPRTLKEWNTLITDPASITALGEHIQQVASWERFGRHLTIPWSLVLTGRPNVGKSSLINALLGYERAIVADEPGTTRDVVSATTAIDGWPVRLSDTAGQRETQHLLEAEGVALARHSLAAADAVLLVLDASEPLTRADHELLARFPDAVIVAHKSDLPSCWGNRDVPSAFPVSSRTRAGLDDLLGALARKMVPELPPPGLAIPVTERQSRLLNALLPVVRQTDVNQAKSLLLELEFGQRNPTCC